MGLILGVVVGNLFKVPSSWSVGIQLAAGKGLEIALLFLAFGINFSYIGSLGPGIFISLILSVFAVLGVTYLLVKFGPLKHNAEETYLVGFGTAICGSAAVAAAAPVVGGNKQGSIGISLAVINLLGTVGMLGIPLILSKIGAESNESAFIIGGSLHSVANVAGAGFFMDELTAKSAITIKLARVALLSPAIIAFGYFTSKNSNQGFKRLKLPWYLIGFILISLFVSIVQLPDYILSGAEQGGKWFLTAAMVAIGLKISVLQLIKTGKSAILFGLLIYLIQLLILRFLLFILHSFQLI